MRQNLGWRTLIMAQKKVTRTFDAMPDTLDFRDVMYVPTLMEVAPVSDIGGFRSLKIPVLNQGSEGACTGFGLATVANYLLSGRGKRPLADEVSAWMFYAMAKRYDEWPGEDYSGSSARGAVKGWHKHGVCALRLWKDSGANADFNAEVGADAISRPLGAYFRVNHKDLVAMHAALTEVGVLYATAKVHEGWSRVRSGDEDIEYSSDVVGGHAFAIVGYDRDGLWIQNSWGSDWGSGGLARLSYSDWLINGTDVWVTALGAPIDLDRAAASASMRSGAPKSYEGYVYSALRPHIITARNDGMLDPKGSFGLTPEGLENILRDQMPKRMQGWKRRRVMLYAHGGLVPESSAVQHAANNREAALDAEVYPISFIWRSDAWTTISNILHEAFSRRRDEGLLDSAKDFMLDRLDDTLEPLTRVLGGKAMWDEMKENAEGATSIRNGAARLALDHLISLAGEGLIDEIQLVGHSAGSVFQAPVAKKLAAAGVPVSNLSLWAPACTMRLFNDVYRPLIDGNEIRSFDLYTLDDSTEREDDCANIYHKSLLYLVSGAFENDARIPLIRGDGTALLGLARDVKRDIPASFWNAKSRNWYVAPAGAASHARHHGDFSNDPDTLRTTLERITRATVGDAPVLTVPSQSGVARTRAKLNAALQARF
jgi:hypothetical protein